MSHRKLKRIERNRDLECCICLSEYNIPKQLPCQHTFCLECITKLCKHREAIPCPLCKKQFTLPPGGAVMLPSNALIMRLIVESSLDMEKSFSCRCYPCMSVEVDARACSYCLDCQRFLCRRCKITHERHSCVKCHKIVKVEEQETDSELMSYILNLCSRHSSREVDLYCCDCKILVCASCQAAKHRRHFCRTSLDFVSELKLKFARESECIEQMCSETGEKLRILEKEKQDLLSQISTSALAVKKRTNDIREKLEAYETRLLQQLSNVESKRLEEMERVRVDEEQHFSALERFSSYQRILLEGPGNGMIRAVEDLPRLSEKLKRSSRRSRDLGSVIVRFLESKSASQEDIDMLLGKISYRVVKQPHIHFNSTVRSIQHNEAISGVTVVDSEIFVTRYHQPRIDVYDSNSLKESRNFNVSQMKSPIGLAGCSYNKALYISDLDLNCIHRVNLADDSTTRWSRRENHSPRGLSVTAEHTLLVTERIVIRKLREFGIVEYTSEGQLLREIRIDESIEEAWPTVQLNCAQFIVALETSSLHRVSLVDSQGQITHFYGGEKGEGEGQLNMPHSLALDYKRNHIFVADSYNNRVLLLDTDLNYLGQFPRDLQYPSRLYFDSGTDRLILGESTGRLVIIDPS